jgi:hypothetical protein
MLYGDGYLDNLYICISLKNHTLELPCICIQIKAYEPCYDRMLCEYTPLPDSNSIASVPIVNFSTLNCLIDIDCHAIQRFLQTIYYELTVWLTKY